MKRRTFLKVLGAAAAALGAGVAVAAEKTKEVYGHWNEGFKGEDRRRWIKRDSKWSYLHKGPDGKLTKTDPP